MGAEGNLFSAALVLGLSAGLSPGPLLALVVSETIRHDVRAGLAVALAPLITDTPIILLSLLVLSRLSNTGPVLGGISILGGAYLLYLGWESLRFRGTDLRLGEDRAQSLKKGIIANFLNPNPYLFWSAVGGPLILGGSRTPAGAAGFFLIFYGFLVGSKIGVAVGVDRYRNLLKSRYYILTIHGLGVLLILFALLLVQNGISRLYR